MAIALEPFLDEGTENDLEAHRKLETNRRLARDDASPVQDVSGENEQNRGPIFEHHHLHVLAARGCDRRPARVWHRLRTE